MKTVKSIIVVGAGTSGWLTATMLRKTLPEDVKISIIESKNIRPISVGESTTLEFNSVVETLNINVNHMLRFCNGTFKSAIKLSNWSSTPIYFPFENYKEQKHYNKKILKKVSLSDYVCHSNFKNHSLTKINKIINKKYKAFQLDAHLLSIYLKKYHSKNINVIKDTIDTFNSNGQEIISLIGEKEYTADLYIDCTGFNSFLMNTIEDFKEQTFEHLINDKAIATHLPYKDKEKQLELVTDGTALEYGWVWNIPLWNNIGSGYVYSSKFTKDKEALLQYKEHLLTKGYTKNEIESLEFTNVPMKNRIKNKCISGNVVGIGISNGFIEPLESTGIMLTVLSIELLIKTLTVRSSKGILLTNNDYNLLNSKVLKNYNNWYKFTLSHYTNSINFNNKYWNYYRNIDLDEKNIITDQMNTTYRPLTYKNFEYFIKEYKKDIDKELLQDSYTHLDFLKKTVYNI